MAKIGAARAGQGETTYGRSISIPVLTNRFRPLGRHILILPKFPLAMTAFILIINSSAKGNIFFSKI